MQVRFWHTFGMAGVGDLRFNCRAVRGARLLLYVVCLAGVLSGTACAAQDVPVAQDEPIHTLHVYTNLIQIPTLVLGPNRERLKTPVAASRFSVSIDSGPWFRATHVRQEGDDPISLSILLDVSGDSSELMSKMDTAIGSLAPDALHAKDHVSIYAIDCALVQSLTDVPADTESLKVAVNGALQSWTLRKQNEHEVNCVQSVHLWEALAQMIDDLHKLPGRRVILAVTDGRDRGSSGHSWSEVRDLAQAAGVAVFGITYIPNFAKNRNSAYLRWSSEDPFHSVCELSGGMVLLTNAKTLDQTLKLFTTLLRERYIVEFPRPARAKSGEHVKQVRIEKSNDFIRPAGISVPIPDAALLADPTTVPSDPSRTPEMGTRAPMQKPQ
jgi:hypothetical protein